MSKKTISLAGMERIIRGLLKDLQVLAAQLGSDNPDVSAPDEPAAPAADSEGGEEEGGPEPTTESLRRSIKAKMRRLRSTS